MDTWILFQKLNDFPASIFGVFNSLDLAETYMRELKKGNGLGHKYFMESAKMNTPNLTLEEIRDGAF